MISIEDLSEQVRANILSFLPIEEVFRASVLSTTWQNIPHSVPLRHLEFCDYAAGNDAEIQRFMDFVNTVLSGDFCNVTRLEKVTFLCEKDYPPEVIVNFVQAAIRLNIKSLKIFFPEPMPLFETLDHCSTLEQLEIGDRGGLILPDGFNSLPNVQKLTLSLAFQGDLINPQLIEYCPVLGELKLVRCSLQFVNELVIMHPLHVSKLVIEDILFYYNSTIVIDAPKLEAFAYKGWGFPEFKTRDVTSLHSVCIDFLEINPLDEDGSRRLAKFVRKCRSIDRLYLSGDGLRALHLGRAALPRTFPYLTCLVVGRTSNEGWKVLAKLLNRMPNLSTLVFEERLEVTRGCQWFKAMVASVPSCLEFKLKKVDIRGFHRKLIAYLLEYGRVLEELVVYCSPRRAHQLSAMQRASAACKVLIKNEEMLGDTFSARENWFD